MLALKQRIAALLPLAWAAMFPPGLGTTIFTRQQEHHVLGSSRKMTGGGSWLVPRFMGEKRLRKPLLGYWLAASERDNRTDIAPHTPDAPLADTTHLSGAITHYQHAGSAS